MITQSLAHGLLRWVDSLSSSHELGNMRVGVLSNVQVVGGTVFVGLTLLNGRDWVYAVLLVPETRSIRTNTQEISFQITDKNDPFHIIQLVSNLGGEKSLWQLRCVMSGKVKDVFKHWPVLSEGGWLVHVLAAPTTSTDGVVRLSSWGFLVTARGSVSV